MEQTRQKRTAKILLAMVLTFVVTLALVLGLMPGMGLTAYATPTETLLTTITATGQEQASYSVENIATVSFSYTAGGSSAYIANWGWWGYGWSSTVNAAEGYTITKCVFYDDQDRTATDSEAPFVVETTEEDKTPQVNGTPILAYTSKGIKKIEVYGYLDPVSYMAWNGTTLVEKTGDDACTDYTVVTADTTTFEDGKWYVVSNSVTVSSRITVTGTANLILRDGATLTASKGITVNSGNTINIYAQIGGTGELNAGNDSNVASIGGGARYQSGGTVNIHGGKITATGGTNASGIGGALDGGNGEVNIYSGEVTARGQNFAAGIGGYSGKSGGTVNIYGGTVNASGSQYGTTGIGIGGIKPGSCVVHIYGGEVTATSEKAAAGMQGTITIDGGTVTANGGVSVGIDGSSGETYSSNGINGTVAINGGTVTATGGNVTASDYMGAIECYGGTIYACSGISGTVTISGGTVTATGGNVTGDINNYGGTIYACNGVNGTVTISGGTVAAIGDSHTGNSSGTTVKEKGFGGSLTLGTGMYLYGGTSANPESDLSNYRAGAGDYTGDRYVYMIVNNVVPHIHSFTYTATGATITAACTAGCDITEGLALTISAPTELPYDGSAKAATLSTGYNTTAFPGEYMIKYYKGANEVEAANVKVAGDYTAKVTVGEATASVDFTIAKATPSIETIPTASAVTYGQKLADSTLTNGVAKLGDNTVEGKFTWKSTETKPSVSDSNITEYAVMFNPTDTDNYAAVECKVKLTVNRAESTVTVPTAKTPTYNGSAQELVNAGSATGGTMYYAVTTDNTAPTDESLYTTSIPTATNAGTYYVWYKIAGDENHNDTEPACVEATINKADPTYTVPTDLNATYGDTLSSVTLPEGWTWTEPTTSVGTVGSHTFAATFTPADTANYNTVEQNLTVTVNANDKTVLIAAIGSASEYYYSISVDYPEIAATLQEAINVATAVKDDENKTVTEISDAVTALNSALDQAKADENQAKADEVKALITAIGTVEYTTESKGKIDEAKAAYATLSEAQKALVTNYSELTSAESTYATLQAAAEKAEADQAAANAVKEKIAAIGTVEYTTESKAKIDEAKAAYEALTSDQKDLVDTYETLTTAESTYATLKADNDAADATKALVDAIGTVELTVNSKAVIDLARESYDGLTLEQKALVTNYDILTAAEARYTDLGAADEVKTLIDAIGDVAYSTESKGKIDAARNAYDALSTAQKGLVTNYETLTSAEVSYIDLKVAKEAEGAINALPATDDITASDKAKVQAAQAKYDAMTPAQKEMVSATVVAKLAAAGNMVAAQEVIASIEAIDASNPDSTKVAEARTAYNTLTADQKALVDNYAVLTAAEDKIAVNGNPEKKSLSGGAIAGIVIAFVIVLSAIGFLVFSYLKQRKNEKK